MIGAVQVADRPPAAMDEHHHAVRARAADVRSVPADRHQVPVMLDHPVGHLAHRGRGGWSAHDALEYDKPLARLAWREVGEAVVPVGEGRQLREQAPYVRVELVGHGGMASLLVLACWCWRNRGVREGAD